MRRDSLDCPWRGVSLGGWLLLEPGPAYPLFEHHPDPKTGEEARCEWDFMRVLHRSQGRKRAAELLRQHRETHVSIEDFRRIRACGLNAVRLPFGYWVVLGPSDGEPYVGPALEYIDKAVDWAEECGLQVVLDLHGCPGGESAEAPCGRRQRPESKWHWRHWRFGQSLKALEVLARRYSARKCVTGIAVCNEPACTVPLTTLCRYYTRAIDKIRKAGMPSKRVAVVLPVFQRDEAEFAVRWQQITRGRYRNICFDVHCYHCFEDGFNGLTMAQQLRAVEDNADMLRQYPMVVGEWSLALGCASWTTCGRREENQVYKLLGCAQVKAFEHASHGSFFWNWTERPDNVEWNFQEAHKLGLFSGPPLPMPPLPAESVEDPLEEHLHPSPAEPSVRFGQPVYLRTFYGRYIDVERCSVQARWADKGLWQELSFVPAADARGDAGREVKSGDVVRIQAHNGKFLTVVDGKVTATSRATAVASAPSEFVVKVKVVHQGGNVVKHRAIINLRCRANSCPVAASDAEEGLFVSGKGPLDEMDDYAWYQELAVEKQIEDIAPATPPKSSIPEEAAIATGATPRRRKTSTPQTLKQVDELTPSPVSTKKRRVSGNTSAGEVSTPGKLCLKEQPPPKIRRVC